MLREPEYRSRKHKRDVLGDICKAVVDELVWMLRDDILEDEKRLRNGRSYRRQR